MDNRLELRRMRTARKGAGLLLSMCLIGAGSFVSAEGDPIGIWPVFRGDAGHSGYTVNDAPFDSMLAWSHPSSDSILYASATVDGDGTIYIGNLDKELVSLKPTGQPNWVFTGEGNFRYSSPAIAADGTIYIGGSNGRLYAVDRDGSLRWTYEAQGPIKSSPNIGSDGAIYFGADDGRIYAVNPDSTERWTYPTGGAVRCSPAIATDGTILVGSTDHYLYALRPDGSLRWRAVTGDEVKYSSPSVTPQGVIYFGSYDGFLYAVTVAEEFLWATYTGHAIRSSPAVGPDGSIFVGSGDALLALTPDGDIEWEYPTGGEVSSSPCYFGDDDVICFGSQDGVFYCVHRDGSTDWTYTVGQPIVSSPAPGLRGMIHVADITGVIWSFGPVPVSVEEEVGAGGLSAWSAFPNPSTSRVTLRSTQDGPHLQAIRLFDAQGRCVRVLSGRPGKDIRWDGTDNRGAPLPAGCYYLLPSDGAGARDALQITLIR